MPHVSVTEVIIVDFFEENHLKVGVTNIPQVGIMINVVMNCQIMEVSKKIFPQQRGVCCDIHRRVQCRANAVDSLDNELIDHCEGNMSKAHQVIPQHIHTRRHEMREHKVVCCQQTLIDDAVVGRSVCNRAELRAC